MPPQAKTAKHAEELGANASKGFIVGGASAGGNLADVMGVSRNLHGRLLYYYLR